MNFKNFDELIEALKESVIRYAENYQNDTNEFYAKFYIPGRIPPYFKDAIKQDLMPILDSRFICTSSGFKSQITNFFNENYKYFGGDLSAYVIFHDAITSNMTINYHYYTLKSPFGYKDNDKYNKKMSSWLKKYNNKKIKFFLEPTLSPYETIKFFVQKAQKNINMDEIICSSNVQRINKQFKQELILDLIKIILCDCTDYRKQIRPTIRISDKNIQIYDEISKKYFVALQDKTTKHYVISP